MELERWLGLRGTAVLGGIVLAIAGFLFVQYGIENRILSPQDRVVIGAIVGLLCFVSAIPLRKRGYEIVASSITGAGAVLLYACSWAAHVLYGMIGFPAAFGAMVAVTVACAWLARRHGSQVIAVLGLVGGFATPIALSSQQDRPIALFGYVLLLDLAFLFVGRSRRWPAIGVLALAGTFVIQALWIGWHMDRAGLTVGLVMLAVFALFFALVTAQIATVERRRWIVSQAGALLLPFLFAAWFAQDRTLGADLWPIALLAGVLAVGAGWIARRGDMPWLPCGSASGAVALAFTWAAARDFALTGAQKQELFLCGIGLAVVHHLFAEVAARRPARGEVLSGARSGALLVALGFQFMALVSPTGSHAGGPWQWVGLTMIMALSVMRLVALGARPAAGLVACMLAGATALLWTGVRTVGLDAPHTVVWCGALIVFGGTVLLAAWLQRERAALATSWAVAAFALPAMLAADGFERLQAETIDGVAVAAMLVLGTQIAFAATTARSSTLFAFGIAATWLATLKYLAGAGAEGRSEPVFTLVAGSAVVFTLWPIVRPAFWVGRSNAWRAAALVPVLWFPFVRYLFVARWPDAPVLVVPLALEALALFAAWCLWFLRAEEDRARRIGRVWYTSVAILFAAMILPVQVGHEEAAVTLALFAAGVALLHDRLAARALPWVAAAALILATGYLTLVRPWDSFPHSDVRVWNSLAYSYLLPAGAAILAATRLRRDAAAPAAAGIAGLCGIVLVFVWINLEIANFWSSQSEFTWRYERLPERDLTASIAWAVYALVLLGLGVSKRRSALRWASLVLLLLTIGKVFLFDLGHLSGLYRAASVFGLGLSLLLVSILYQRFVFRRAPAAV